MEKIIKIKGNVKSENENGVLLLADEQCIFGIDELFDETDKGTLTWFLLDEKENQVAKKTGKWNEKLLLTIDKKLSGDYRYQLGASFKSKTKDKTYPSISIGGYCEPKIISAKTDLPQKTGYGIINGQISIEAEGLNGNTLDMELDFADSCYNFSTKCVEGRAIFKVSINTTSFLVKLIKDKKEDIEKPLQVSIMDKSGVFIKDSSGKDILLDKKITISAKQKVEVETPKNNTIVSINKSDKIESKVNGIIELEKIKIPNSVTGGIIVCNDVSNKDKWILSDDCHWTKKRDENKPDILPVAFPYTAIFKLEITIKCLLDIKDGITIRIQSDNKYFQFDEVKKNNLSKGKKYDVSFANTVSLSQITYIKECKFKVQYSLGNNLWIPLQNVSFEFYITKSESIYPSMLIPETLLYIGCKQCNGLDGTVSDEVILDKIFDDFRERKVCRRRENNDKRPNGKYYLIEEHIFPEEGMGYWRGISTIEENFKGIQRNDDVLLKYGEARCDEWSNFLIQILQVQGIANLEKIAICTSLAKQYYPIMFATYIEKATDYDKNYYSTKFAVKNAKQTNPTTMDFVTGDSPGQGTNSAQPTFLDHVWVYYSSKGRFFDPSYGKKYSTSDSTISHYCSDSINSIHLIDRATLDEKMNTVYITETDIHKYIEATKNLF